MTKLKPIVLKPASFPQHVVEEWRYLVNENLDSPSKFADGALLGVDIAHMLCGAGGYPVSEVAAFFFQEGDLCRAHIACFPSRSAAQKCYEITEIVDRYLDSNLLQMLFHHSTFPGEQLQTLIFRDFSLFYDAGMPIGATDLSSSFKLILHEQSSKKNLMQLKQDIEMCLAGLCDGFQGLGAYKFVVDIDAGAAKVS